MHAICFILMCSHRVGGKRRRASAPLHTPSITHARAFTLAPRRPTFEASMASRRNGGRRPSLLHVVLALLVVELALLLGSRVLVLLVLGDEVVHVRLCFREFHLVHALSCVPMEEGLAAKHCRKSLRNTLEH